MSPSLRPALPKDHLIQTYTEDAFLVRVVGDFIRDALAEGEGCIVIATASHVAALTDRLTGERIDVAGAVKQRQLLFLDAERTLAEFTVGDVPDRSKFLPVIASALDHVRAAGYRKIRAFGEMVDLLWGRNVEATVQLEELWNEVLAADQRVTLLCAYRLDVLNRRTRGVLHQVTLCHSQSLPLPDGETISTAVDRAFAEVFGTHGDANMLRTLMVSTHRPPGMPEAQAALLALPNELVDEVFDRARTHYADLRNRRR